MQIEEKLSKFIQENRLFTHDERIMLGVSGGKDSMLMTFLLHRLGFELCIAHCNFNLRGEESDKDEELVRLQAEKWGIPFFSQHFDTQTHARTNKISIQMSARELRYNWFELLRQEQNCAVVAIAQHRQDNIETVFVNLLRGTGLQGLQGILPKRDRVVRPILFMGTEEISQIITAYNIPYRDDQTNFSTKYARNKVRRDILPILREIKPEFDEVMEKNIIRFGQTYRVLQSFLAPLRAQLFIQNGQFVSLQKAALSPYIKDVTLLYELFLPFGFESSILEDLSINWDAHPGSIFESKTHEMLLDRDHVYIRPKKTTLEQPQSTPIFADDQVVQFGDKRLQITLSGQTEIHRQRNIAQVDSTRLVFPLSIRYWEEGDRFVPLGMVGKKKLSDFFIQQKIPLFEKSHIPILVNGNGEIIWVVGHRLDNRYKISDITNKVVTFVYS